MPISNQVCQENNLVSGKKKDLLPNLNHFI